ncbi:MAG: aminoacyl-tRNA hydrolase [Pseudomonadota bacterium]
MASQRTRFLVVGLGNPGPQYENTRHNIGFQVIDELATRWKTGSFQKKFKGLLAEVASGELQGLLLKPQTYMNLSGDSVREVVQFYKVPLDTHLIVVTDDLDLPPGSIRVRPSGGTGGHNGLKSITDAFSSEGYSRVRVGIGRSQVVPTESYVLSTIPKNERELYLEAIRTAADAVEMFLKDGVQKAMNTFNKRKSNES